MFKGELTFELGDYGKLTYYVDQFGAAEVYLWMDHLGLDKKRSISELDWKLSLSDFDKGSTELSDLEYTLEEVEVEKPEDESCYLSKRTLDYRVIDSEEGKKQILELLKEAPFVFLKEGDEEWIKKFQDVLAKEGRTTDKYVYYVLYPGNGLEVEVEPESLRVRKEGKIIDKEDPQKAKELIELFEKVMEGQMDLRDAISKTLKSLGLNQEPPRRRM